MRHQWWDEVTPAAGACVMATGIISVGLHLTGHEVLSKILLAVAALVWLLLAADFVTLLARDRARWTAAAVTPPALTAVAATAVLGTRFSLLDWQGLAIALLVLAAVVWPGLLVAVVRHWGRDVPRPHWGQGLPGGVFLVCVATQGLAVLAATLCLAGEGDWLGDAALACFALGLLLYAYALLRFDFRQTLTGAGDHWVAGGALAISALAASKLTAVPLWTGGGHDALRTLTFVLLALSLAWYAVLLAAEVARPRFHYDVRRWATVFPLGMTAVAALSTGVVADVPWLRTLGRVLLWVAVAGWGLVWVGFAWARAGGPRGGAPVPPLPETGAPPQTPLLKRRRG
ncbi:tellurite resistance/C4-dicarboxylate transporter family protein [Streptomyces alboflavus]|uniref:tellurite resistance/C4-dicarboxylate transporter family protein n=1 Tax=Streptomyces alboflavus TaxID=67267 RepID=UPI0023D93412|nr:tellurite resistance/C4-dicarboxylate transporter family protein [Streptomyces alboflavus]